MAGPTDTTEEWPPLDVRYLEPVGFYWPDNPKEGKKSTPGQRMCRRIFSIACLIAAGKSPKEAVDTCCQAIPNDLSMLSFMYTENLLKYYEKDKIIEILESLGKTDPDGMEKSRGHVANLYAIASNHPINLKTGSGIEEAFAKVRKLGLQVPELP